MKRLFLILLCAVVATVKLSGHVLAPGHVALGLPAAPAVVTPLRVAAHPLPRAPRTRAAGLPGTRAAGLPRSALSHVNLTTTDARFGIDEAYLRAASADALGARWSRIPFIWSYVQPGGPASWNPFSLSSHGSDAVVDGELARGRSVVGLLLGTPPWARQNAAWGEASVPVNIDLPWNDPRNYWGAYCRRLATHYAGRINDWIIWNEVSIPPAGNGLAGLWTQWRGTIQQYARMLEVAYRAVHAANPAARVVMYGDPYWYDHGAYLTQLYAILAAADPGHRYNGFFDAANLHLYSNPTDFYWIIRQVRGLLGAHGWAAKPIWVSETNAEPYDDPTHPAPHTNFRVSMAAQAAFLVDALASDIAAGADRIEVYRMFDGAETRHGLPAWGLVNNAGELRPVGRVFQFLTGLFRGARGIAYSAGAKYDHKGGVFMAVDGTATRRITVLWNQDRGTVVYHLPVRGTHALLYDKFGHARVIQPHGGVYTFALPGGRDFTNPFDTRIPTVGGDPAIVVEDTAA